MLTFIQTKEGRTTAPHFYQVLKCFKSISWSEFVIHDLNYCEFVIREIIDETTGCSCVKGPDGINLSNNVRE